MRRRQKEQLKKILIGMGIAILVLVVVLVLTVIKVRTQRSNLEQDWIAARQAEESVAAPVPVDPYDGLEAGAIALVRGVTIDGAAEAATARAAAGRAATTIGSRVESNALESRVEAFQRAGVERVGWRAERVGEHTIYQVDLAYRFHSVEFGPRWYVQMNPEGPAPEQWGRAVPSNGLAEQLHAPDMDEGLRFLNRADEVLQALTEHRFQGGTRLGSALLVFFEGRQQAQERRIIGWHVVPEATDPDGELIYRAFFQWEEDGAEQDAWWEVNLTNRGFQAKDLQANDIMALGTSVAATDVIDIRPRTLDLQRPPSAERNPRIRALRHILADQRLVEAVGTLLGFRARTADLEYVGWEPNVTAERHVYDLACIFREGDEEVRVTWRVDANTGEATPTSDIAGTAQLALSLVSIDEPAEYDSDAAVAPAEGSGSGSGSGSGEGSSEAPEPESGSGSRGEEAGADATAGSGAPTNGGEVTGGSGD